MKTVIRKNTWLNYSSHGWGNGYVIVPVGHLLHGVSYNELYDDIDVHGGLTFSALIEENFVEGWDDVFSKDDIGSWCFGFDTAHYRDTLSEWPKERVQEETDRLKEQLMNFDISLKTLTDSLTNSI